MLTKFRKEIVAHYQKQLRKDKNILPKGLTEEIKQLNDGPEYKKLTQALSEWMVLIELCKDLLVRIETYELDIFIAGVIDGQLEKGWLITRSPLKQKAESGFSRLTSFLSSFAHHVEAICETTGVTEHYEHIVQTAAVGFITTNPTVCVGGLISLWFAKAAAGKYSAQTAKKELQKFTDLFCRVTTNLNNRYEAANLAIAEFY